MRRSKENRGRPDNTPDANYSSGKRGGGFNYGRSARATSEAAGNFSGNRSNITVDIRSVERMREAIIKADDRASWRDGLIIAGAIVLAMCVLATLILSSAINARANRLLENDAVRVRAGSETVSRLEKKLDDHIAETKETNRKLDAHTATTTTTTTPRVAPRKPVQPPKATTTTRVAPTTTRPTTTTTKVVAPATTLPPCKFALFNICLSR